MDDTVTPSSLEALARSTGLTMSEIHEAFVDERRRAALRVLANSSTPVDVSTVARSVAASEAGTSVDSVPPDQVHQVHVRLYHVHLPKLERLGLLEYDADADAVTEVDDGLGEVSF